MEINDFPIAFVFINILLGVIPFFLCYLLVFFAQKKSLLSNIWGILVFVFWLLFAPNAPYILSDMRHINGFCPNTVTDICVTNTWMIAFFFVFALVAWPLYFYMIEQMREYLKKYHSEFISKIFPFVVAPIIALGLLLGLLDRFNSWDMIFRLDFVLASALDYFMNFEKLINLIVFSIMLVVLYISGKIIFKPIDWEKYGLFKNRTSR